MNTTTNHDPVSTLTADQLSAIRARVEAATPGPWKKLVCGYLVRAKHDQRYPEGQEEMIVADTINYNNPSFAQIAMLNAAFIAHARTDIPALLAHIGEQQKEIARLQQALSAHQGDA